MTPNNIKMDLDATVRERKVLEMIYRNPLVKGVAGNLKQVNNEKNALESKVAKLQQKLKKEKCRRLDVKINTGKLLNWQDKEICEMRAKMQQFETTLYGTKHQVREMCRDAKLDMLEASDDDNDDSRNKNGMGKQQGDKENNEQTNQQRETPNVDGVGGKADSLNWSLYWSQE